MKRPNLYLQGGKYYFKAPKNPEFSDDKSRTSYATGTSDRAEAEKFLDKWLKEVDRKSLHTFHRMRTLADVIRPFCYYDQNPAYIHAKETGRSYTERYARHVATYAKQLGDILSERAAGLLYKNVEKITRKDCWDILRIIRDEHGVSSKTANIEKVFKTILAFEYKTARIETNPAAQLERVKPEEGERVALRPEDVATLLNHPEIWPTDEAFCYFALTALTGMRRSEVAALDRSQLTIEGGRMILNVNMAFKDDSFKTIDKPKWGFCRIIPLCRKAEEIINKLPKFGPLFPDFKTSNLKNWFKAAKLVMSDLPLIEPEICLKITPHVMRHSLYTNLCTTGANRDLANEYLSWAHQEGVSDRYLHIKAKHLESIADHIDDMYSKNDKEVYIKFV